MGEGVLTEPYPPRSGDLRRSCGRPQGSLLLRCWRLCWGGGWSFGRACGSGGGRSCFLNRDV